MSVFASIQIGPARIGKGCAFLWGTICVCIIDSVSFGVLDVSALWLSAVWW